MADLLKGENSGVIAGIRPTDYRAGGESTIVYQIVESDGDWIKYKPTDEWQRRFIPPGTLGYDTNSCTDFSCMNSIEVQIERMLANNLIPADTLAKMHELEWFDANGNVNFNDWYNAILAGTTDEGGNTLYNTWDAVRKYGLLPQSKGFTPNDFTSASGWFGIKPTPEQVALGKRALDLFDFNYEWIDLGTIELWDLLATHLKQAPLHVLVRTGDTWNSTLVTNTEPFTGVVNHAVTLLAQNPSISHTIVDHYNPFVKQLEWNYYIPYVLKGVVTLKGTIPISIPFHYVFNVNLKYGTGATLEVHKLQEALQYLGYMKKDLFGIFGSSTKAALGKFQSDNGITDPDGQGANFGPKTRSIMNAKLA